MTARRLCVLAAQLVVAGALTLSVAACTCPPPDDVDQTFVLDETGGTPLDLVDAGLGPARDAGDDDAASRDGGGDAVSSNAVMSPFRGTPDASASAARDCTSAAAGCAPGGTCAAACACVLMRARVYDGTVRRCTLLAGAGVPQVRVGYTVPVFCGGD
jgi:hypothetical protein